MIPSDKKYVEETPSHEEAMNIKRGELLCMDGVYFRILDIAPLMFDEERRIDVRARFEGIRTT